MAFEKYRTNFIQSHIHSILNTWAQAGSNPVSKRQARNDVILRPNSGNATSYCWRASQRAAIKEQCRWLLIHLSIRVHTRPGGFGLLPTLLWPMPEGTISRDHTFCCGPGYTCLSNGLCMQDNETHDGLSANTYVRGSCTDQTWRAAGCPSFCIRRTGALRSKWPCYPRVSRN